ALPISFGSLTDSGSTSPHAATPARTTAAPAAATTQPHQRDPAPLRDFFMFPVCRATARHTEHGDHALLPRSSESPCARTAFQPRLYPETNTPFRRVIFIRRRHDHRASRTLDLSDRRADGLHARVHRLRWRRRR